MYAVVGVWQRDPELSDQQQQVLDSQIVPGVRRQPGLVAGYWAGEPQGNRSYTFIVFDDRSSAEAFAADVRANEVNQSASGVTSVELAVVPVSAYLNRTPAGDQQAGVP